MSFIKYIADESHYKEVLSLVEKAKRTAVVRITLTEPPVGKHKQYDKEGEELKWGRME